MSSSNVPAAFGFKLGSGAKQVATSTVRVLIVDDYEPWRRFVCSVLDRKPNLRIVGEVADGAEAVQQAAELQPDLILMDIGLPILNGVDAAYQIHQAVPEAKVLFASENHDQDVVRAALSNGAKGYILKSDGKIELLSAIEAPSAVRSLSVNDCKVAPS